MMGLAITNWIRLFLKIDPLFESVKDSEDFQKVMIKMDTQFWTKHEGIKNRLHEVGVL